ncbi:sugar phosphate isomerase/epimerase [Cohnella ginsengisoli]|uniref:Sugar phosphate isomerase/epimerase n=1 Tax=Cohnella ginsengisoli TaxID=425004 RepID=A0A9X4KM34_9BACL|nr:TIM barrel protein [Cohnella ginsengisoli]MDG0792030.1 sugar phosphate isomerase/epimerase [Cohnella ginsengisoli]
MIKHHINSWTFEKWMGPLTYVEWDARASALATNVEAQPERLGLAELIARLGAEGYGGIELAYPHLKDRSAEGLAELRRISALAGVELNSLLLDFGDPGTADAARHDAEMALYREWIDAAAAAGFRRVRIGAGDGDDDASFARAAESLSLLSAYAGHAGVRVVTENLGALLSRSDRVLRLLEETDGSVGLTADFGNFKQDKYRQLEAILPHAETVHAKAREDGGGRLDSMDFRQCVQLARQAGYEGPLSLTYLGGGEPWAVLAEMRELAAIKPSEALRPM